MPTLHHEFHFSSMGGHSGIKATLARLSATFYWPRMHKDVKQFVNQCSICQLHKDCVSRLIFDRKASNLVNP